MSDTRPHPNILLDLFTLPPDSISPISMPDIVNVPHRLPPSPFDFPLGPNATMEEVVTLIDSLALKVYPKGYWQVSWVANSLNLSIFFCVAMAMRLYRSRKASVPLWLFKIEERPYRVKRRAKTAKNGSTKASSSMSAQRPPSPVDVRSSFPRRAGHEEALSAEQQLEHAFQTSTSPLSSQDQQRSTTYSSPSSIKACEEESEMRMGRFITASCVNCHLVMTSAYVVLLFIKTVEDFVTRSGLGSLPLLDPGILETFMMCTIFSTAYFAAVGYIAILLPDVSPRLWNGSMISAYLTAISLGVVSLTKIAVSTSKIKDYRHMVYNELLFLPSLKASLGTNADQVDGPALAAATKLAELAYQEALDLWNWLQFAHGTIACGALALSVIYLIILLTLTRKIAQELVQIRTTPSPNSDNLLGVPAGVTVWPSTAVPFSLPTSPFQSNEAAPMVLASQPARSHRARRRAAQTPPLTPAPSGPLPLPPPETPRPSSLSSSNDADADSGSETHDGMPDLRRFEPPAAPRVEQITAGERSETLLRHSSLPVKSKPIKQQDGAVAGEPNHASPRRFHGPASPTRSGYLSELDLGPRTRLDAHDVPWGVDALHEDVATNEGYVAVCRFLFNCIIDHTAVMLQCLAFGGNAVSPFAGFAYRIPCAQIADRFHLDLISLHAVSDLSVRGLRHRISIRRQSREPESWASQHGVSMLVHHPLYHQFGQLVRPIPAIPVFAGQAGSYARQSHFT